VPTSSIGAVLPLSRRLDWGQRLARLGIDPKRDLVHKGVAKGHGPQVVTPVRGPVAWVVGQLFGVGVLGAGVLASNGR
jgi:hypothetical protein